MTPHQLTGLQLDEIKVIRNEVFDNLESSERLASTRVSQLQMHALANIFKVIHTMKSALMRLVLYV